jgi:hypothetical protein
MKKKMKKNKKKKKTNGKYISAARALAGKLRECNYSRLTSLPVGVSQSF